MNKIGGKLFTYGNSMKLKGKATLHRNRPMSSNILSIALNLSMMVITSLSFSNIDQDVPLHTIRDAIRCIIL
jgi:hypothetical protein